MQTMGETDESKKKNESLTEIKILGKNNIKFQKVLKIVMDVGDWNVDYHKLSTELDIPTSTIYWWRNKILTEMPAINPLKTGSMIISALESSIRQCQLKIRTAETETDKRGYMNTLCNLSEAMTDMLEKYGHKKIVDKGIMFQQNNTVIRNEGVFTLADAFREVYGYKDKKIVESKENIIISLPERS